MSTFYTKEQIDSLAVIIGNRIKDSVSTLKVTEALLASPEYALLTKEQKQTIESMLNQEFPVAAVNIDSFIAALDGTPPVVENPPNQALE